MKSTFRESVLFLDGNGQEIYRFRTVEENSWFTQEGQAEEEAILSLKKLISAVSVEGFSPERAQTLQTIKIVELDEEKTQSEERAVPTGNEVEVSRERLVAFYQARVNDGKIPKPNTFAEYKAVLPELT